MSKNTSGYVSKYTVRNAKPEASLATQILTNELRYVLVFKYQLMDIEGRLLKEKFARCCAFDNKMKLLYLMMSFLFDV